MRPDSPSPPIATFTANLNDRLQAQDIQEVTIRSSTVTKLHAGWIIFERR